MKTTAKPPTEREIARQRAIDRLADECTRMIQRGMQMVARAELLHRQRVDVAREKKDATIC